VSTCQAYHGYVLSSAHVQLGALMRVDAYPAHACQNWPGPLSAAWPCCHRCMHACGCRYETWRRDRLSKPRIGSKLRNFALGTIVPVALAFYCAKRGVDMETVSSGLCARGGGGGGGGLEGWGRATRPAKSVLERDTGGRCGCLVDV
jgi:hypothetical protein